MKEKRLDYELMRILAIFLVVFNHTDNRGFFLYQVPGCSAVNAALSLLLATICKTGVPLFFMVSGGLLLHRQESLKKLFCKRIVRMALVLVLFSSVLYGFWIHWGFVPNPGVKDFVRRILTEGISIPYWYLYTYLGVLFLLPLLRPMAQNLSDQGYMWLFCVHFGFFGVIAPLSSILKLEPLNQYFVTGLTVGTGAAGTPFMAGQAVYYMLMGYYFAHRFSWEKRQQTVGKQRRKQQYKDTKNQTGFQRNTGDAANGVRVAFAAILGVEHYHGVAHGNGDLLHQELYLIDGGSAGQGCLTVAAQHNIVCHVDGVGKNILKGYHQNQPKKRMVKDPIPGKIGGIHKILPFPAGMMAIFRQK